MKLYDYLLSDINSGDYSRIKSALVAIYWISDLQKIDFDASCIPDDTPYVDEIRSAKLDVEFTSAVKELLRDLIKSDHVEYRASAIGILGSFADIDDKNLISEHLEMALIQLLSSNSILHQSIVALDLMSEIDLSDKGLNLADPNRNIEYARAYLKQSGKTFPW